MAPESFAVLDDPANNLVGQAAEGTLFLHGISELTPAQQRNLLAQMAKLERYHTRLICSSSKPLARMVAEGSFDARLFSAISPIQLRVPSLREHPEDVPELAKLILERCVEAKEVPPRQFSTGALNALRVYDWPGNLAELENVVKSTALLALRQRDWRGRREQRCCRAWKPRWDARWARCRSTWRCAKRATPSSACTSSTTSAVRPRT